MSFELREISKNLYELTITSGELEVKHLISGKKDMIDICQQLFSVAEELRDDIWNNI